MKQDSAPDTQVAEVAPVDYAPAPLTHTAILEQAVQSSFKDLATFRQRKRYQVADWAAVIPVALKIISGGHSVRTAARLCRVDFGHLWDRLNKSPHVQQYARAIEDRASGIAEKALSTIERDDLDPNDKRVRLDGYKWFAGRLDPRRWDDRLGLNSAAQPPAVDMGALAAELAELESKTGLIKRIGVQTVTTTTTTQLAVEVAPTERK